MSEDKPAYLIYTPPKQQWKFRLQPGGEVLFYTRTAPSWLHRQMQRVVLGIVWERIDGT